MTVIEGNRLEEGWGSFFPTESVQEIVRKNPETVPERYVRNKEDEGGDDLLPHLFLDIPVIDLFLLASGDEEELKKLDMACRDWGFFQIINHDIPIEVLQEMKLTAREFFQLPLEDKMKYFKAPNDVQGYSPSPIVHEQQKLDWADILILQVYPKHSRRENYWPIILPDSTKVIEAYSKEASRVAQQLLGGFSKLLGLQMEELLKMHCEVLQVMRMNYYPICPMPEKVIGVSPHADTGTLTLLLQEDDNIDGLQIRHLGGWVPIKPLANALFINIGDVIEVLSNGRYKSVEHRAMANERKERISIATFICPSEDVQIEPLASMVSEDLKQKYIKFRYGDYLNYYWTRRFDGKTPTNLELIKIEA
ncbi:hypothetical protein M5K25_006212 [Dendrobium thyrsiflorum]|uniref:Fe2OG dioxygenase domain-containing protein n=1 Tax=Dendrobium thyrsiflorum TaxID=117978 RepID=A0ABD0VHU5_DENTH